MKFQALLLVLALTVPAVIHAQDYSYTTNEDNTLIITGYSGPGGAVNIPRAINGLPVAGIGTFAFLFANVSSVTIPEGVTSIGYDAFSGCTHLTGVLFPHSLTSLGNGAFSECYSLGTILFPSGLTNLAGEVFYDCPSLTQVYFAGDAPTADSYYAFYSDNATVYYLSNTVGWGPTFDGLPTAEWNPNDKLVYITNADNTITITGYTGPGGDVPIPAMIDGFTVAGIGASAFSGVWSLTSVAITNGAPSIASLAFAGCPNLSSVTIGDGVTNIAPDAFSGCNNLTSIEVDPLNPDFSSLDGVLFDQSLTAILCCPNGIIGSYDIPDGVTGIGDDAFSGCFGLTNITIPATVARIGSSAFASCTGLTVISMPDAVTNIGDSAFSSCSGLTNITIPSAVNRIGSSAFANCTDLSAITIPSGVICIASSEFSGCTRLTNVTLPANVTNIGAGAFSSCPSLTSFAVADAVTTIGSAAFSSCSGLTNFTIGAGVTNIAADTFVGCVSLQAFTVAALNSAYISLGGVLFNHSQTALIAFPEGIGGSYAIPGGVTTIGDFAFFSCGNLTNIVIPDGVTNIGNYALNGCGGLASLTVPASVAGIGDGAFAGLYSVTTIYFLGDAPAVGSELLGDEFWETLYYFPWTSGWVDFSDSTGLPTAVWLPQIQSSGTSFGPATNLFGFNVAWASGLTIVVEACTNLANPDWQPIQTNTLTDRSADFSDPQWTNCASRFYRVRLQ